MKRLGMLPLATLALAALVTAQDIGTFRLKTDVTAVTVLIDGKEVGRTPLTLPNLAAGAHQVTLSKDGYETQQKAIQIDAGGTTRLFVVMRPMASAPLVAPVTFRGVHQHANGRCIGTLLITRDAVEFKADDGKDVFSIPIASIRNISRSSGERMERMRIEHPGDEERKPLACRLETAERAYGFWAYEGDAAAAVDPRQEQDVIQYHIGAKTRELFTLVYKLWSNRR